MSLSSTRSGFEILDQNASPLIALCIWCPDDALIAGLPQRC